MFRYMPTLRYRQQERGALQSTQISDKMMPLLEIVREKPNDQMKGTFSSVYAKDLSTMRIPFMVDIPLYIPISTRTEEGVSKFLLPLQRSPARRLKRFRDLAGIQNLIPVVTYDPRQPVVANALQQEAKVLRDLSITRRLGFRLFYPGFTAALAAVTPLVTDGDILVLDIDVSPHSSPVLQPLYGQITRVAATKGCASVLLRAALDDTITNVGLAHGQPVPQADNSLLQLYTQYGFTAFGDYAGVKKDLLEKGGTTSPGIIYYSWTNNYYAGFRYQQRSLKDFKQYIVPSVMASPEWKSYTPAHHANCPGCQYFQQVSQGAKTGESQAVWKGVAVKHYLYTMEEFL